MIFWFANNIYFAFKKQYVSEVCYTCHSIQGKQCTLHTVTAIFYGKPMLLVKIIENFTNSDISLWRTMLYY